MNHVNWHDIHLNTSSKGDRLADYVANLIGSWRFIIIQTTFVAIWMSFECYWFPGSLGRLPVYFAETSCFPPRLLTRRLLS
jgi:hypothetical protein